MNNLYCLIASINREFLELTEIIETLEVDEKHELYHRIKYTHKNFIFFTDYFLETIKCYKGEEIPWIFFEIVEKIWGKTQILLNSKLFKEEEKYCDTIIDFMQIMIGNAKKEFLEIIEALDTAPGEVQTSIKPDEKRELYHQLRYLYKDFLNLTNYFLINYPHEES